MIIIRDDDVLRQSSAYLDPVERLKKVHRWILEAPRYFLHVAGVLVTEIQEFPEAIKFIKIESEEGRMKLELHGLKHIDYGALDQKEIEEHLEISLNWMDKVLNVKPTKFFTPWGTPSDYPPIARASNKFGLQPVDCSLIRKPSNALTLVRRNGIVDANLEERDILFHWWEQGMRIPRLIKCFKYGSYKAAKEEEPELYQ